MAPLESIGNTDGTRPLSSPCLSCYLVVLAPTLHLSAISAALFIFTSQQYPRTKEGKEERTGCIPVINFRPSAGVATRHHLGHRRPPSPLSPSIENMRGGREGTDTEASRDHFKRGESYQIARLLGFLFS